MIKRTDPDDRQYRTRPDCPAADAFDVAFFAAHPGWRQFFRRPFPGEFPKPAAFVIVNGFGPGQRMCVARNGPLPSGTSLIDTDKPPEQQITS